MRLWQLLVDDSMEYLRKIYARLNITLTDADMAPESFYNSMLGDVCDELESKGIAVMSDGALCAFPPGFTGRDGKPVPLMLRKSDGGYGYDSTDAAAIRYRLTAARRDQDHLRGRVRAASAPGDDLRAGPAGRLAGPAGDGRARRRSG